MKILLLLSILFAVIHHRVDSATVKLIPPSDLEVGALSPDDELLYMETQEYIPAPGKTLISTTTTVKFDGDALVTYIKVQHMGNYPDARVVLDDGGPGHDFFIYTLYPGPLGGLNYTAKCYGVELKKKAYTIEERSKIIYH